MLTLLQIEASPSGLEVIVEATAPTSVGQRAPSDSDWRFIGFWGDTSDPVELAAAYTAVFGNAEPGQTFWLRLTSAVLASVPSLYGVGSPIILPVLISV